MGELGFAEYAVAKKQIYLGVPYENWSSNREKRIKLSCPFPFKTEGKPNKGKDKTRRNLILDFLSDSTVCGSMLCRNPFRHPDHLPE